MTNATVEAEIEFFLAKYSPAIAGELRAARLRLRSLFPRGHELVFDNYNALVFAFASTERASDAFLSVAGYPRWVTLFFLSGVDLRDPGNLLQGTGRQVRSIRLERASALADPAVQALIGQAIDAHREALDRAGPLQTRIKSVSAKQRSRQPAKSSATGRNTGSNPE